jgi:hypothetical protein
VLLLRLGPAALGNLRHLATQVRGERAMVGGVGLEGGRSGVEPGLDRGHGQLLVNGR